MTYITCFTTAARQARCPSLSLQIVSMYTINEQCLDVLSKGVSYVSGGTRERVEAEVVDGGHQLDRGPMSQRSQQTRVSHRRKRRRLSFHYLGFSSSLFDKGSSINDVTRHGQFLTHALTF